MISVDDDSPHGMGTTEHAGGPGDAARLARYVKASIARLGALSLDRLEAEPQPFAAPETIA